MLPFGVPAVAAAEHPHQTPLCRHFYATAHDNDLKVPIWVAWRLDRNRSLGVPGCVPDKDQFRPDPDLPKDARADLEDYRAAGPDGVHYSRGHMANSFDFRFSALAQTETYFLSNMLPQLQANNGGIWLTLENAERAWALQRGEIWIIAGGVPGPQRLGPGQVAIPTSLWKVVVDLKKRAAIGFLVPHQAIGQGDLAPFVTPITDIEELIGFKLPLPAGVNRDADPALWAIDLAGWNRAHDQACPGAPHPGKPG
jgi:endonuclease G